jgi:hypothetical protein
MRVLCINDDFSAQTSRPDWRYVLNTPKEMESYTVKEVQEFGSRTGYVLDEIFAGFNDKGKEISFSSTRFVPVEEINTLAEATDECVIFL